MRRTALEPVNADDAMRSAGRGRRRSGSVDGCGATTTTTRKRRSSGGDGLNLKNDDGEVGKENADAEEDARRVSNAAEVGATTNVETTVVVKRARMGARETKEEEEEKEAKRPALPRAFETLVDVREALIFVGRFLRARGRTMTVDVVCESVERSLRRRCSFETLRRVAAAAPGALAFTARTSRADDLRRIHVEIAVPELDGDAAKGGGLSAVTRQRVEEMREALLDVVLRAHDGEAYEAGKFPETWRKDFNLESVPLPEPVEIALTEDVVRDEPRLVASTSAPTLGACAKVTENELARTMSDMGADGKGLSARAVQAVLERQAAVEAFNDPSAVADRARRKIHGRLPYVFDAVRSAFATSKRRVMELNALVEELANTNAGHPVAVHELADSVRILARTCPEWCSIAYSKRGDEELFRLVSRDPMTSRSARQKIASLMRDA